MGFNWSYQVRFGDTDGAGVVYFARSLEICHGAYEASLAASGINLQAFFSGHWIPSQMPPPSDSSSVAIAVPIVATEGHFYRPCFCGDSLTIQVQAHQKNETEFEVKYRWLHLVDAEPSDTSRPSGTAMTRHACVQVRSEGEGKSVHRRCPLPPELHQWLAFVGAGEDGES